MNITELDSYNLADAVKFHNRLNPKIWDRDEKLLPEVREKLLEIAADFQEFLGVSDLEVEDITISGSNAAYSYTPHSDIDLHLVVRQPQQDDEVYQELFNAKKYQYNDMHNIRIHGADVELYVQPADESPVSLGEYSIKNDQWLQVPRRKRARIDQSIVRHKYEDLKARIENAIKDDDSERIQALATKIKEMRRAGLDAHGEFGPENLAYKILRKQGYITKLYDAIATAKDRELSLQERKKKKRRVRYGFGGYWYPGFGYGGESGESGGDGGGGESVREGHQGQSYSSEDGVAPSTQMFLNEDDTKSQLMEFIKYVAQELGIKRMPKIHLHDDPEWGMQEHSFGKFVPETHDLHVNLANRHIMDIMRTTAHELAHCKQHEVESLENDPHAGDTGSDMENEAHAVAGIIMRQWADAHPEMFDDKPIAESSGYIPTRAQARDPRFKMALTVDVHPGQTGKEANKMALHTDAQGRPALLMKTVNLRESLAAEFEAFSEGKSYGYNSTPLSQVPGEREDELGNQEATGPEFPPQMPAGTTKIDVKDLTDWYQLGMDISDMDDAKPENYNQGPPQTVITFPSDEAEQGYLKQFKRLGLKTHDMDPDVEGGEDVTGKHMKELEEDFALLEQEFLGEVKMTSGNLAKLVKDIKGVKVGLEFEMIVPNTDEPGDSDMEPDYDQDDRVRDIDDCVNFFDDGDYNSSGQIRRLRDQMYEDFYIWRSEMADNDWYNGSDGFDYFRDYLDREDPFDEEEAEEEARNQLQSEYGDKLDVEEFEKMLFALVDEKRESYVQDQWDEQGRNFDDAREEYMEERVDDYSEQDWLENQGIRYASDVESNYGDVTWPYYTSGGSDDTDVKQVALNFMNAMGMRSVAVSDSYHGNYQRWNGSEWVDIGRNKPDDCFAIEPDGSLEGNESSDAGLEFVSPPIPLEDIGTVMQKVQAWAADNGVYTGKSNKTSIHTNISVPGYDIKNLDYLKAALLLGDEYVLREFDRIGNSYAKPAIDKVRQLVKSKPEKAQELLDKMKSQLNAEASKLLHSGVTDKFTSINTKDNRIEFRSPGGDYLSIIADDPQKMIDTINRMVVTMDAAIDPNKYKEEYQKKLYKLLTGQQSGREAASGKKQEMKKDDKDLLNIFSRYAAGELPKAALKSFVRQAQLQRKVAKGETSGKMWWNVKYNGQRIEVVADSEEAAKKAAAKEWGGDTPMSNSTIAQMTAEPLRPYTEPPAGSELERIERQAGVGGPTSGGRPSNPDGNYVIVPAPGSTEVAYRFMAASPDDSLNVIRQWRAEHPSQDPLRPWVVRADPNQQLGQPNGTQSSQQNQGNWGIWIDANNRFANQPGEYARGAEVPLMRFPSREAAESWLEQQRAARPNLRTDIDVREIAPRLLPGSTLDLQRQRAAQASPDIDYEIYNRQTGEVVDTAQLRNDNEAMIRLNDYRNHGPHRLNPEQAQRMFGIRRGPGVSSAEREPVANIDLFPDIEAELTRARAADAARGGIIDVSGEQPAQGSFTGEWKVVDANTGEEIYRFGGVGNSQSDANRVAGQWVRSNSIAVPIEVYPVMGAA